MAHRISTVIAVYNGAALIRRSIESVLAQTAPCELIVVDDGSTDGTSAILSEYASRVRCVSQSNKGVSAARNRGILESRAEWVAFLDHDDEWLPRKLELQVRALEESPRAALCYTAYWWHSVQGGKEFKHLPVDQLWRVVRLRNPFPPSVVLMKKAVALELGGFKDTLKCGEDWDLFIRCLALHPAVEVTEPLANYYELETSASRNYRVLLRDALVLADDSLLVGLVGIRRALWRRRIRSIAYYRAAIAARENDGPVGTYLLQSLLEWPFPNLEAKRVKAGLAHIVKR